MRSEEQIRTQKAILEKQMKEYRRIAMQDLSMGAFAAVFMEYKLGRKIEVLKWVLEEA